MDDEKLKRRIGANIALYRKSRGLTQAMLAEKINYSDKAVSKWERGESVPDVLTLMALAEQLEITVNDLLADPDELPQGSGLVGQMVEKTLKRKADKRVILGLSSLLVWFVALFFYVVLASLGVHNGWLAFVYAIPVDAIVMLSLRSAWHDFRWNRALISGIVWGVLLSVYLTLLMACHYNVWRILLLGIPGQAAIFLWFRMFRAAPAAEVENDGQENTQSENS